MAEQLVKIELIKDNPYQPRMVDNAEHIENLARSIAADELLQKPTARNFGKNGACQLAFGHSRRKAFEWLRDNWKAQGLPDRYNGYSTMPIELVELSDEEMCRFAISENVQRKDLSPIELAKAMIKYRDEFKKSSDEVGALFGVNGATVRGLVRLLELPDAVQDKVASGEITQGAARSLLTIARVDEKQVAKAVESFAAGASAEDVIYTAMSKSDTAFTMWNSWNDGKPRGGGGLWPLDMKPEKFPMKHLSELRAADVAKAMGWEFTADLRSKIEDYIETVKRNPAFVSQFAESHKVTDDVLLMERIGQLLNPPACAACPFHASADRSHYCGFKPCHNRKRAAWVADEMEKKISKKLSIAVYNPVTDGKTTLPLHEKSYESHYQQHAKLVADKDADLRIAPHKNEYSEHKWTESRFCRVIVVGKKAERVKEKKREDNSSQQAQMEEARKAQMMERALRDASRTFTADYAVKLFAAAFKTLEHIPAMCALVNVNAPRKTTKKAEVLADLRTKLAREALSNLRGYDWQLMEKGPSACAKYLQGVATAWGIKLPADFMDVAKGYQPVSAETKAVKK